MVQTRTRLMNRLQAVALNDWRKGWKPLFPKPDVFAPDK
jgi:hypothetical protein